MPLDSSPAQPLTPPASDPEALFSSLLYAASHDLRSPLLTMSLSADLIESAIDEAGASAAVALEALRHGARDAERMLHALATLSRAYRRPIEPTNTPLKLVLAGHLVISEESNLEAVHVAVELLAVREMLDAVAPDGTLELHVQRTAGFIQLTFDAPGIGSDGGTPLDVITRSLQYGAGEPLEAMAVGQVLLERQGGAVTMTGERVTAWLPLTGTGSER